MANTSTLQPTLPKEKLPSRRGIFGLLDDSIEYIAETVMSTNEGPVNAEQLRQTAGPEWQEIRSAQAERKLAIGGRTEYVFNNPDETALREQRAAITKAEMALRRSRAELIIQEEVRYEVAGMSEQERNERLHLNPSLRKRLTEDAYHMTELYRQRKKELARAEQTNRATEIPSPAKRPHATEVIFEGGGGTHGKGQANISFQAVG